MGINFRMNWLAAHGLVSTVFFLCLITNKINKTVGRRLQVDGISQSAGQTTDVEQAIMVEAGNVSVLFSAIFFFFLGVMIVAQHINGDLHIVQRSILRKRLEYSMFICLYICFFSCLFNVIQYGPQDDAIFDQIEARDTVVLDIGRPIEWLLTCPLMQLILPILGGEKVPDWRRMTMPVNSGIILCWGVAAMFSTWLPMKLGFYFCGVFCFGMLMWQMNGCIKESTDGAESLFWGSSSLRILSVIVALTWIPFPIWYALSPEGFNIVSNSAAMKIAVAFLNVLSKGAFIYYLMRVRGDHEVREMVLADMNAVNGVSKKKLGSYGIPVDDDKPETEQINGKLSSVIFEVLYAMGRQMDFEPIKEVLETHMITTQEDLQVLTQEYCNSIGLPFGFVTACKQRIKQRKVENADNWTMNAKEVIDNNFDTVSTATAPLPPQVANDPRKLKEYHSRTEQNLRPNSARLPVDIGSLRDDVSEAGGRSPRSPRYDPYRNDEPYAAGRTQGTASNDLYARSQPGTAGMTRDDLQASINSSQNVLLNELREMKRAQMEEASRIKNLEEKVDSDLNAVQDMMGGVMTQVMDKIDSRLRSTSAPPRGREQNGVSPGIAGQKEPVSFAGMPAVDGQGR
jgi:bacteriorhodopsin